MHSHCNSASVGRVANTSKCRMEQVLCAVGLGLNRASCLPILKMEAVTVWCGPVRLGPENSEKCPTGWVLYGAGAELGGA